MAVLSRSEIASYARSAGFNGRDLDIAVAVALAESGGDTKAYNGQGGDRSYGLWQINMIGGMGPDRRKRFNLPSNDALYDPATNARVAYGIWKENGWSPWTTYTSGKYKDHMSTTTDAPPTVAPPTEDAGLFGIGATINSFGETVMRGMASVGAVIVAVVLLVLGVVILGRNQVGSLVPGGKLAKVAKVAKGVSS